MDILEELGFRDSRVPQSLAEYWELAFHRFLDRVFGKLSQNEDAEIDVVTLLRGVVMSLLNPAVNKDVVYDHIQSVLEASDFEIRESTGKDICRRVVQRCTDVSDKVLQCFAHSKLGRFVDAHWHECVRRGPWLSYRLMEELMYPPPDWLDDQPSPVICGALMADGLTEILKGSSSSDPVPSWTPSTGMGLLVDMISGIVTLARWATDARVSWRAQGEPHEYYVQSRWAMARVCMMAKQYAVYNSHKHEICFAQVPHAAPTSDSEARVRMFRVTVPMTRVSDSDDVDDVAFCVSGGARGQVVVGTRDRFSGAVRLAGAVDAGPTGAVVHSDPLKLLAELQQDSFGSCTNTICTVTRYDERSKTVYVVRNSRLIKTVESPGVWSEPVVGAFPDGTLVDTTADGTPWAALVNERRMLCAVTF